MKTLSELERERRQTHDAWAERVKREREQLLAEVRAKPIPLYVETEPTRISDSARRREEMRHLLAEGHAELVSVACDHCGTQLINRSPGHITLSHPPLRYIGCIGCGWVGYMEA